MKMKYFSSNEIWHENWKNFASQKLYDSSNDSFHSSHMQSQFMDRMNQLIL